MKYLSLFLLATVLFFSCGDTAPAAEETTTEPMEAPAPEAPAPMPKSMLDATVEAVQSVGGDITALPAGAAVSNIEGWIAKLETMDGTEAIVSNLGALKTELTAGKIDGAKVSTLLSSLAEQTKGLAADNATLGAVAAALQAGADKLGGK